MQAALIEAIAAVRQELTRLSLQHKSTATIGRTHGQHAIPITMGFKFANYLYEFSVAERFLERVEVRFGCADIESPARMSLLHAWYWFYHIGVLLEFGCSLSIVSLDRLRHIVPPPRQIVAKFSGAVGTFASLGTSGVQASIMKQLGVTAAPISTQVRLCVYVCDIFLESSRFVVSSDQRNLLAAGPINFRMGFNTWCPQFHRSKFVAFDRFCFIVPSSAVPHSHSAASQCPLVLTCTPSAT